ncbi:LuxR C-terminal-related transcriptional regulator [Amycolatopsis jiangsuensis]|uniref:DNA-binding NarL/FixJ family response regulator n=1 Tax=Amycolatopsis jiangsuensis TaxID=1181879 RepID=A0A840J6J3_9PSEU|nr:LuxR C-terminal-related transcriptional regulator [Amycolatopsis jiangsuensis]MBB4689017.1 DNA-binding NarL/FixJ family response regulator [Amycolatopsis jiangsuensis]
MKTGEETAPAVLTVFELRVAELAATGTPATAIAETLGVSANAVAEQLRTIYRKLGPPRSVSRGGR